MPSESGPAEPFMWSIIDPFALLWVLIERNPTFGFFLAQHLNGKDGGIVLYSDGTTPGNKLAAWGTREVYCWYWTFAAFPTWFRARSNGWFVLGTMPATRQKAILGGASCVAKCVLHYFFRRPLGVTFTQGFQVSPLCYIRATLAGLLLDGLAHKQITSTKGASGKLCCMLCQNVVNTKNIDKSKHQVHYSVAKRSECILHTHDSFYEQVDKLASMHGRVTKKAFGEEETRTGLVYHKHAVIYDPSMRCVYSVPKHTYFDAMHCLLTSGGIAQWEVNAFLKRAVQLPGQKFTLALLDKWRAAIRTPRGAHPIGKEFAQRRIVLADGLRASWCANRRTPLVK